MNRRSFLKAVGVAIVAPALAPFPSEAKPNKRDIIYHKGLKIVVSKRYFNGQGNGEYGWQLYSSTKSKNGIIGHNAILIDPDDFFNLSRRDEFLDYMVIAAKRWEGKVVA